MALIKKGQYVKTMSGISPAGFGNRVGKVVGTIRGNHPFKYRDIRVHLLDGDKSIKTYEQDTLEVISFKQLKEILSRK